ncbi:MAG: MFS transporter [Planctomycetes bacterium]|nr:MFS transporter [Planctomycetota bacterium]
MYSNAIRIDELASASAPANSSTRFPASGKSGVVPIHCRRSVGIEEQKHRTVTILLGVSVLYGAGAGLYEFVLPYYLQERRLSFQSMGIIFALSTAAMFIVRLASGRLSDQWGARFVYLLALAGSALGSLLTPLTGHLASLTALKTVRDVGGLMRDTAHPILLFAEDRARFRDFIGRTRGVEFLFQAGGTFLAGVTMGGIALGGVQRLALGNGGSLLLAALLFVTAGILLAVGIRRRPENASESSAGSGSLWRWDLAPNLKVIMASSFIFSTGLSISHCFIMPLFFSQKFGVSPQAVAAVMVVHRFTIAVPMLFAARIPFRNPKRVYILTVAAEGVTISLGGLIPGFIPAAAVWLLHDLIGAGIWIPIQSEIIQQHCREDSRGLDLSKTLAFSALGGAIGPILAGWLADWSISAPFVVSGLLLLVAAAVLCKLDLK